jgi:hypothetical protein
MSKRYRLEGTDEFTDAEGVMYAAELAYAGGLLEEMPADADEACDAFEALGFEIEIEIENDAAVRP